MTILHDQIPLGEYVFLRILQANPKMKSIFGVPGDYNLNLMEYLYKESILEQDVKFVGNCNELNAAYTADGYSRIIETFAVLITTLGVGELSALNGVASAYSEFAPLLHIVGSVATFKERTNDEATVEEFQNWHHLIQAKEPLDKPDVHVFSKMSAPVSICTESLTYEGLHNGENFDKIDNVIKSILKESRPGYLYIPADLPDIKVSAHRLIEEPFLFEEFDHSNTSLLEDLTEKILSHLYESERPALMSDDLIYKFHAYTEFSNLIQKVENNKFVKLYSSSIAKYIDETLDNFMGVYPSSNRTIVDGFQDSDCAIVFGYTNFETKGFYGADHFKAIKNVILINPDYVKINDEYFYIKSRKSGERPFALKHLIANICSHLDTSKLKHIDNILKYQYDKTIALSEDPENEVISLNKLYNFASSYIRPTDIVMCEISSFSFGISSLPIKKDVRFIYNSYYASIGYALPAALGVGVALKDLNDDRRVILFEGDGSAQMTAQELSTYLRFGITKPQIFLMNNEGYTIERAIKGESHPYNDIQLWNWEFACKMFGDAQGDKHLYRKFTTAEDFDAYFATKKDIDNKLEIYDVMMKKTDYSDGLKFFLNLH